MFERTKRFMAEIREAGKCRYVNECDGCEGRMTNGYSVCPTVIENQETKKKSHEPQWF